MSVFARTPESFAAWQQLNRDVALRSDRRAHRKEKVEEQRLLLAGRRNAAMPRSPFLRLSALAHPIE